MHRAMALPRDETTSRTVLIVTDGYIGAEREVFGTIQDNLNRTNVFAFGIGGSVNRFLIEGMAKAGQGEPFVVTGPAGHRGHDPVRPGDGRLRHRLRGVGRTGARHPGQ